MKAYGVVNFIMSIEKHPGYFGLTSRGVIAIHADWPMYPSEHGYDEALLMLCSFPKNTKFIVVDDIDQCILFRAVRKNNINSKDEYVAIWHDDLKELTDKRCIDGVRLITEYQLKLKEWKEVQGLFYKNKYGVMVPSNISKPEFDSEYDYEEPFIPSVGEGGIKVTKAGFDSLQETLCSLFETIHLKFLRCVEPLIEIGRYDTAVREGCLLLECSIKEEIKSDKFGLMLVDEYCDFLIDKNYLGSFVKPFRQELKNAFRYVRNDYMHNIKQIERDESKAILARVARLYQFVLNEN